jgi:hypothetical protein
LLTVDDTGSMGLLARLRTRAVTNCRARRFAKGLAAVSAYVASVSGFRSQRPSRSRIRRAVPLSRQRLILGSARCRQKHDHQSRRAPGVVPVSDRGTLGVSQSVSQFPFRADPLARKPLILKTRRDVRVVEGARLEINSGDAYRVIPKHLFA